VTEDSTKTHAATFRVPAQHPALAGHFPGNPIVPGVMVLDAVISAAQAWLGEDLAIGRLSYAKFLAPIKPDETAQIDLLLHSPRLEFSVCRGSTAIAKGAFDIVTGHDR
jgi:3-hydroxyacyl-[acyl-carrier-protein] dehydratase